MKKSLVFVLFSVALIILPNLSAQEPEQQAGTPSLMDELNTAIARAEEVRKKAGDFESSAYFPSDWEAAEAQYASAAGMPQETGAEADAITAYNTVADAFDALLKLTIPLYAQAREDEIMALRNNLVAGGRRGSFPEYLSPADKTAITALDQYEAEDYYAAKDSAAKALVMYQTLTKALNAWLVRREIEEREFESYDTDNFNSAGEVLRDAMNAYDAEDYPLAQEKADEALNRYNLVLSTGWAAYAELRSSMAVTERQAAVDIKANVVSKDIFAEADLAYKQGMGL